MLRFVLTRAVVIVVVLVSITVITFLMLHLLRPEAWAFDTRPLLTQLAGYLADAARLDFGTSWDPQRNQVSDVLAAGLPADVWLLAGGLLAGCAWGAAAGVLCAARPASLVARALTAVGSVALIAPVYWVGLMLLLAFGSGFGNVLSIPIVRSNAYAAPQDDLLGFLAAIWLPWLVLSLPLGALVLRMTRSAMVDALDADFLRTARAKGLGEGAVVGRHALPAASTPVLTLVGTQMATLVTNVVLVETVFSIPGAYQGLTAAMNDGNFPLLQGLTVATAALVVVASLLVDLLQAWLDPQVRRA